MPPDLPDEKVLFLTDIFPTGYHKKSGGEWRCVAEQITHTRKDFGKGKPDKEE